MYGLADTVAAIATAPGAAALGIVRISGPGAAAALDEVVPRAKASTKPRRVIAEVARNPISGAPIDEVLCFYCPAPSTATGEDTAEIHGHGGQLVMKRLLDAAIAAGARAAEPGEFTYRAFRNGRIDLTQAEGVMGLIGARSERAAQVAYCQLSGDVGRSLGAELDAVIAISAQVEAGLDFPDEDLPLEMAEALAAQLDDTIGKLSRLRDSFVLGARLSEGAHVAIIGPPNAGKSSLLNRLVGEDRALVDKDPGTTRDVVDARGEAAGIPIVFSDTAGLRSDAGRVERRGMEKTAEAARGADLVVVVVDGASSSSEFVDKPEVPHHERTILGVNKKDLPEWRDMDSLPGVLKDAPRVPVSALTGEGIDHLLETIARMLGNSEGDDDRLLTTARQHAAVAACVKHLEKAAILLRRGSFPELAADDLRSARDNLAVLWGREATEEMLDAIFSKFCIGK
ncbi:MAG: tRNA uridine-5-carboxymethylaminomethyl(34) synthesis GTPase MnmE [Deltaproteobacteria bacterium]|nr:tRNA uridine-5-carboxymethylaminomethyl(34) synthesis GTPase MnmE [Deltaproteobacteria bacterium]